MGCWVPSPWARPKWARDRDALAAQAESPHQAAIAMPAEKPKRRTRKPKTEEA